MRWFRYGSTSGKSVSFSKKNSERYKGSNSAYNSLWTDLVSGETFGSKAERIKKSGESYKPLYYHQNSVNDSISLSQQQGGNKIDEIGIHTDSHASNAVTKLGADAITVGKDIFFGNGKYDPKSEQGVSLLKHELFHANNSENINVDSNVNLTIAEDNHPGEIAARSVEKGEISPKSSVPHKGAKIFRHKVAPSPVARKTSNNIFGDGTPANPGMTLEQFDSYTRQQADWFVEPSLTGSERADLWGLLFRSTSPHILAGVGDIKLSALRGLTASDWSALDVFSRGCHAGSNTIRIANRSAYTLADRIAYGATLTGIEAVIPPAVLELTVSEAQLRIIHTQGLLVNLHIYWYLFQPHLQKTDFSEFQNVINLITPALGVLPYFSLLGRIRNLHRFTIPTLRGLVTNYADKSRSKPVHLIIHTGHDAGAFQAAAPQFESLVLTSPNLVLMIEGQPSLASITAEIPNLASTYGQPDSAGNYRLAQVMIAGHGQARSVELAGTGAPTVSNGSVSYPSESLDLDTNYAATSNLLATLMSNMEPANARLIYYGCLVGANRVPSGTAAAAIPGHIAANPSLATFTENLGAGFGMPAGFVQAGRASLAGGGATSFQDASGNLDLAANYSWDPMAFSSNPATYLVVGHEPEGVLSAAVEVAATQGPVVAETLLRTRAGQPNVRGWWDDITMLGVNILLSGVAVGSGININKANTLAHMIGIPFVSRWPSSYAITVAHFVNGVNNHPAIATSIYAGITATTDYTTTPDNHARNMRFIVEQARLARGEARAAPLISYLDTTPQLNVDALQRYLDVTSIGAQSSQLFPVGASVTSGRIRLALAWLQSDPTNVDVRAFLNGQVTSGPSGPALTAVVRSELGGLNERGVLRTLGRLTATTPPASGSGPALPNANAEVTGDLLNDVRVESRPYIAEVLSFALNVRTLPSMSGTPYAWLRRGDKISVMGFVHNWAAIDYNGTLGFVHKNYISSP